MNEVSNDKRFSKTIVAGLVETRKGLGDGLFTVRPPSVLGFESGIRQSYFILQAYPGEENWGIARTSVLPVSRGYSVVS